MTFRDSMRGVCGLAAILSCTASMAAERVVRIATFNVQELNWAKLQAVDAQGRGIHPQLIAAAEIIQRVRPDVLLLNEIDYTGPMDTDGEPPVDRDAVAAFQRRYLAHAQHGAEPIAYPHRFYRPSNTGVPSGIDLNGDGETGGPNDAYGFGRYPGEYALALLSRFPIDAAQARTFRKLLWKDVPGRVMPDGEAGRPAFYSPSAIAVFRLSSKSHWDVPVQIGDRVVHLLCSHPTPPVFDGPEDAHGRRNFDELRFWSDYLIGGERASHIRDDAGRVGGFDDYARRRGPPDTAAFVILGDLNAEPVRNAADYSHKASDWVLQLNPRVVDPRPTSPGGTQDGNPGMWPNFTPFKTSHFGRLDYVLPSRALKLKGAGVFWPAAGEPHHDLAEIASDHRLVWIDIVVESP